MKYDITHKCGHESTQQLYGKSSERERRAAYLETTLCPDCYRESQTGVSQTVGKWIEMHYGEYKNNYAGHKTRDYNAKSKTIMVLVSAAPARSEVCPKCGTYCHGDCSAN